MEVKNIKNKNFRWLVCSGLALVCFIIATWGFAFRTKDGLCIDLTSIKRMLDSTRDIAGYTYLRDSFGFMIAGYVFAVLVIVLILMSIGLNLEKTSNYASQSQDTNKKDGLSESGSKINQKTIILIYYWIYVIFYASFILFLIGEIIFIHNNREDLNKGYTAGMFIFTILPIFSPLFNNQKNKIYEKKD